MSYVNFNDSENSILVCKGDSRNRDKLNQLKDLGVYSEYHFSDKFAGIKISDFLSKLELDGLKGELMFKELLEKNKIPYLYVGQGPFGIERSRILIEKTKSKRADYLVNIKDMGTILFDVKCRNRIGFHNSDEKYFSLFVSEINALDNLQKLILMPVWLAFIDRSLIHKTDEPIFYFISISTVVEYLGGLFKYYLPKDEFNQIKVLRIPQSLFTKIGKKIIFEVGYLSIDDNLLKEFAEKQIALCRVVQDKIKEIIRSKDCLKSHIYNELKNNDIDFCFSLEVASYIELMIHQNVIDYKPKKYLRLIGE